MTAPNASDYETLRVGDRIAYYIDDRSNSAFDFEEWFALRNRKEVNPIKLTADPYRSRVSVGFAESQITVGEGNRPVVVPVCLSDAYSGGDVSVELEVVSSTAREGVDFRVVANGIDKSTQRWTWRPLQRFRSASVLIFRDGLEEPIEEFTLRLKNPLGCRLGEQSELKVAICDRYESLQEQ